jgi:peptide/nickel transport system permease protein
MSRFLPKNKFVRFGMGILIICAVLAIFAPQIAPYDPYAFGTPYLRPCKAHWLGTNDIGQDILSELIYGTRVSLIIGIICSIVVTVIGTSLGMLAGYYRGLTDRVITSLTHVAMCIPSLPLAIILAAYLNASIINLIIAISITAWTGTLRIVRSRVFQLRELPFIKIEQALGVRGWLILFKHILPNVLDIVLMRSALSVAGAMLTEAGLSFLGLGVYKQKSWGGILHYAFFRNGVVNGYWWWILPPIIMISLTVLGFVLVGYYGGTTRAYASSMSTAGGQSSA